MLTLSLITSCTNRKRISPGRALTARTLRKESTTLLAREWVKRVREALPVAHAGNLYQGRAFLEASKTSESMQSPLYVISAGLGLLHAEKKIASYSLTVSTGSEDAIQNRCTDPIFSTTQWWRVLNAQFGVRYPLSKLIAESGRKHWLLAVPINYFELVADDLNQLSDAHLKRLRIVGPQINQDAHRVLKACLLDIDDRLNGPDSPLAGTQADFAQRAARFAYEKVIRENPEGEVLVHRRAISGKLAGMRHATKYKRQAMSDEGIMRKIKALWKTAEGRSGRMLRLLRDQEQIACEQRRFKGLFKQVQMSVIS